MKRLAFTIILLLFGTFSTAAQEPEWLTLTKQAQEYFKDKDYRNSNNCYKKALDIVWSDRHHPEVQSFIETLQYAIKQNNWLIVRDSLDKLAFECRRQGEYEQSNAYFEQMIPIYDSLGWNTRIPKVRYFMAHNDVDHGIELIKTQRYEEARPYMLRALERDTVGSKTYYMAHNWLGHLCDNETFEMKAGVANLERAVKLYEEADSHFSIVGKVSNAMNMRLMKAKKLVQLNRKEEAMVVFYQVAEKCKGIDSLRYSRGNALSEMADLEKEDGNFKDAIKYYEEAYSMFENDGDKGAVIAFSAANGMALLYRYELGDTVTAKIWEERAEKKREDFFAFNDKLKVKRKGNFKFSQSEKHLEIVKARSYAMELQIKHSDIDGCIAELTTLIEQLEQDPDVSLIELAKCYDFRCGALVRKNNFEAAASDARRTISLSNLTGVEGVEIKCGAWYALAGCLWKMKNENEAMTAADSCVKVTKAYYGDDHMEVMEAYVLRGNIAVGFGRKNESLNSMMNCYTITKRNVERNFVYMTSKERWSYWNNYNGYVGKMPLTAYKMKEYESAFTDTMYSEQLLAKGLLLTTDIALRLVIENDTALKRTYEKIRLLRKRALESDNSGEILCANRDADQLERDLGSQANSLHKFIDFLKIGVNDVKKKLPAGSAAVEFVNYGGGDTSMMGALVLMPNRKHVHFVPLMPERQLHTMASDTSRQIYYTGSLTKKLWGELAKHLTGVNTVYFSPAGDLHSIGIEYLPDFRDTTKLISDRWRLYRMSSTRELALNREKTEAKGSATFGGMRFNADTNVLKRDAQKHYRRGATYSDTLDFIGSIRGDLDLLPGTKIEAKCVDATLNLVNINNQLMVDTLGTESAFKSLDGKRKKYILVSTHGRYYIPEKTLKLKNIRTIEYNDDDGTQNEEDLALTRSVLFFTGSLDMLRGIRAPQNADDGVLTAREISELDFRGMDMVVLSACETGLGEIGKEGVFGLQRGFKKAGVNSIMMSLWSVDDYSTLMLMSHFYDNYFVKKMSKKEALDSAQAYVRDFEIDENDWVWDEEHKSGRPKNIVSARRYVCNYEIEELDWEELIGKRGAGGGKLGTNAMGNKGKRQKKEDNSVVMVKPYEHPYFWAGFVLLDGIK